MKRWQVWGDRGRRDRWTMKLVASYPYYWMAVIKCHFFVSQWGWGEAGVCREGEYTPEQETRQQAHGRRKE